MGRYNDTSIKKLVNGINQEYFLPDIQRPFVWKNDKNEFEGKVCSLFDSILRNYPIGTLLFWKIDKKRADEDNLTLLKFLENSNTYRNDKFLSISSEKDYILVLDGQQRMTIFNLVFKGIFEDTFRNKIRRRNLYFNLLTDLDKNELKIAEKQRSAVSSEAQEIGRIIKETRNNNGWSQKELAEKTGFSQQMISFIENGYLNISLSTLTKIAHVLSLTLTLSP